MKIFPLILIGIILLVTIPVQGAQTQYSIYNLNAGVFNGIILNQGPYPSHCPSLTCAGGATVQITNGGTGFASFFVSEVDLNLDPTGARPSGTVRVDVYTPNSQSVNGIPTGTTNTIAKSNTVTIASLVLGTNAFTFTSANSTLLGVGNYYSFALELFNTTNLSSWALGIRGAASGSAISYNANTWVTNAVGVTMQVFGTSPTVQTQINNSLVVGSIALVMLVLMLVVGFIVVIFGIIQAKIKKDHKGLNSTISFGLGAIVVSLIFMLILAIFGAFDGVFAGVGL